MFTDDVAGPEGIEPPIEVLETPGIPFTYGPTWGHYSKGFRGNVEGEITKQARG